MRILIVAGVVLVGSVSCWAGSLVTRTTAYGTGADAFILGSNGYNIPGSSGTAGNIYLHSQGFVEAGYQDAKGYVRFDVTGMAAGHMESATLKLALLSNTLGNESGATDPASTQYRYSIWGLKDGYAGGADDNGDRETPHVPDLGENWSETGLTWANAPGHDAQDVGSGPWFTYNSPGDGVNDALVYGGSYLSALGTFDLTGIGTPGQVFTISTPQLLDFLNTDTNGMATFIICWSEKNLGSGWGIAGQVPGGAGWKGSSQNGEMNLASWETGGRFLAPTLEVFTPEPTAAVLLLAGISALGLRRRRT